MKKNNKIIAAVIAVLVVIALAIVVIVTNNKPTSNTVDTSSKSEVSVSDDVVSENSKEESSKEESSVGDIIIGTAPEDDGDKVGDNGNIIDFPSDDKSSSSEEVVDSTSKEEPTPTITPGHKEENSSSSENVTTPDNSSSSSNVVVVPPVEEPTPSPTPTTKPVTPSPTPSVTPTPTTKPSGDSNWSGGYDNLPSEGFDHIKVPTKSDFYDEGFDDKLGAFDFDGSDWSNEWWDAYQDFLVANGSPIDSDGNPMGAFNAIHDGSVNGYQYLYYGVNWSGSRDGWGDIALLPRGLNSTMVNNPNYDGAYVLELTNFTYGNMDKEVENEYRAATTMMLSWIVPNPQEVEKAIYDAIDVDNYDNILANHVAQNGYGSWLQIGDVDVAVAIYHPSEEAYLFSIRAHR